MVQGYDAGQQALRARGTVPRDSIREGGDGVASPSPRTAGRFAHLILPRLAGVPLLGGGLLAAVGYTLHPENLNDPLQVPVHLFIFFGILLIPLGLAGLYARQCAETGLAGLAGFLLLFFGLPLLDLPHAVVGFTAPQVLASPGYERGAATILAGIGIPLTLVGVLVLGVATMRAHVLPRGVGALFLVIFALGLGTMIPGIGTVLGVLHFPAPIYVVFATLGVALVILSPPPAALQRIPDLDLRPRHGAAEPPVGVPFPRGSDRRAAPPGA